MPRRRARASLAHADAGDNSQTDIDPSDLVADDSVATGSRKLDVFGSSVSAPIYASWSNTDSTPGKYPYYL